MNTFLSCVRLPFLLALVFLATTYYAPAAALATLQVSSPTHPSLFTRDFNDENEGEEGLGFAPYQSSGARLTQKDGALTITNAHAGSFGIEAKIAPFDADVFGHLVFDYLIPPAEEPGKTVRIDLLFQIDKQYHVVRFTGPKEVRPGDVALGELEDIRADGQWHRAYVPLRAWLRALYPHAEKLTVDKVLIGNWDNTGYLMAGIGGNSAGAVWKMKSFSIFGVGPESVKFEVKPRNSGAVKAVPLPKYFYAIDGKAPVASRSPEIMLTLEPGTHLFKLYDADKKPVASYGFLVGGNAPAIGQPTLQDSILKIPIATKTGLESRRINLSVDGKTFQADSPYLSWSGASNLLSLDAGNAGFNWKQEREVPLKLTGVQDLLGKSVPEWTSTLKVDYSALQAQPSLPALDVLKEVASGTFEESLDEWAPKEGSGPAIVERDSSTSASGKYSVRLTSSANAATMGAWIRRTPFDATRYPVIEFDYKIPPDVRVDFQLRLGGQVYTIGFTDRTPAFPRIGQIADVKADGQWHHARIELLKLLRAHLPTAPSYEIEWLAISDSGYLGNARGLQLWIDNFQMVPVVKGAPFKSKVVLPDISGARALSWTLDDKPKTVPPAETKSGNPVLETNGNGKKWLHLRAQNGAGKWSEAVHLPLALDAAAPTVGEVSPSPEAKSGAAAFTVKISDDTSIDRQAIKLSLQGKEYSLQESALVYDSSKGVLSLNLQELVRAEKMKPLDEGAAVSWKLFPVRDAAGQSAPEQSGKWFYDRAADKTPPDLALSSPSHPTTLFHTFDKLAGVREVVNAKVEVVDDSTLAGGAPNKVLRVSSQAQGRPMRALLIDQKININEHNMLGFHYKIPPETQAALRVAVGRRALHVAMVGKPPNSIGEIPGIVADGQWHWAQFDLKTLARTLKDEPISSIELADPRAVNSPDTAIEIDNLLLQSSSEKPIQLEWKGSDLSGIATYRFAWDQDSQAVPTEETTETARTIDPKAASLKRGLWWAHVQAKDKAGNWSAVSHLPIIVP